MKIYAQPVPVWAGLGVELYIKDGNSFATKVIMEEKDPSCQAVPVIRLEPDQAQFLMDQLWFCGYRPSEGTGSAGSLAATEKHLGDMRRIVFKQLEIE